MISNNLRPRLPRRSYATTDTTERVYEFRTQELRKRLLATTEARSCGTTSLKGTRDTPKEQRDIPKR